jgi:DNA-binding response OmpR family regulator
LSCDHVFAPSGGLYDANGSADPQEGLRLRQEVLTIFTLLHALKALLHLKWPSLMERILIIDDDPELCALIVRFLAAEGFETDRANNANDGIAKALSGDYALIMLDVMMPDINGFDVLRRVRAHSQMPVVMLTARGDTLDRVLGLEMGADDYLPKPFDPSELAARIRAILRRTRSPTNTSGSPIVVGDMELNGATRTVLSGGKPVELTAVEFDLLATLMKVAGTAVSREELVRSVLGRDFSPFDRSIDTHVCNLRKKIGRFKDGNERIKGIRGTGYLYAKSLR